MQLLEDEPVKLLTESPVGRIVVNRPKALNALNADVLYSLQLAFQKLQKSPALRAIILTGEGDKAFVAGADIPGMSQLGPRAIADYVELGQRTMRDIELCRVPVIAAINGYALGGGLELALACDIIVASSSAKFGQPEVNLGIIPGFGGTQRLVHRCGLGTARRLVYTGDIIAADEALRLGLVDMICGPEELSAKATAIADNIAAKAPLAVQGAKKVLRESQDQILRAGLRHEVDEFLALFGTVDREEGMEAFMQKRPAKFYGK